MTGSRILIAALFGLFLFGVSGGSAQDSGDLGDLGIRVRQENVDSYWMENRTWAEYGYRPTQTTSVKQFTNLPSYFAGKDYYSYGTTPPEITPKWIVGRTDKDAVQMTKYGTWH